MVIPDALGQAGEGQRLGSASVTARAFRAVQAMIRSGRFRPGDTLPGQRELAAELGVSRPSLREALSVLAVLGAVRVEPRRGVVVAEARDGSEPDSPPWRFADQYTPEEVYQFRAIAETQAASLAAMHVTDEELLQLQANVDALKQATRDLDFATSSQQDFEFHHLVMRFSRNRMLVNLHRTYHHVLLESVRLPLARRDRVWEPVVEHERVLKALRMRDPDGAAYYMRSHIARAAERVGVTITGVA